MVIISSLTGFPAFTLVPLQSISSLTSSPATFSHALYNLDWLASAIHWTPAPTWVPLHWPLPINIFKVKKLIFFKACSSHFLSGPNHPILAEIYLILPLLIFTVLFYFSFFYNCCCLVTKSCPTLWDPMNYNPPGSSVLGIFQARILECIAISFSRGSSQPRDWTCVSCIDR